MELTFKEKHDIIVGRNKKLAKQSPVESDSFKVDTTIRNFTKKGESTSREKTLLVAERRANGCTICGYNRCKSALDFHHRNPKEKKFLIQSRQASVSMAEFREELDKCVVLCANCHREVHAGILSV